MAGAAGNDGGDRPGDPGDFVKAFRTVKSHAQGRVVRLTGLADRILQGHAYPDTVCAALGEALGLTALLGAVLGSSGKLIVQTQTDGPVSMIVVNFEAPGRIRGYAGFDAAKVASLGAGADGGGALLGSGHLALTIDKGGDSVRHQGIVPLDNVTLTDAAHTYFRQSEQIPTFIRLAVAKLYGPRAAEQQHGAERPWRWCVGGIIVQHLPVDVGGLQRPADIDDESDPEDSEDWQRVKALASTVEYHELLDPMLAADRLLYRLFAEEEVMSFPPVPLEFYCRCSRERVETLLRTFGTDELDDLKEPDGAWSVKCEFCNTSYRFEAKDLSG
ncbi:MAG: 33 kDa chaperonin [Pseudomonadota bacterium]|jgi:molecular chaperone Hsp33